MRSHSVFTLAICGTLSAGMWIGAASAEQNTGGGLNFSCGAWGPSTSRPGFQCRRCERCSTNTQGEIDCTRKEIKTQCTDGATGDIAPPAKAGGTRPPTRRPPVTGKPPTTVNPN